MDYGNDLEHTLTTDLFYDVDTHNGLVNLMPLLFNQIGKEQRVNGSLDLMLSDSMLSQHGLRSLSRYDVEYHEGRDGWRGNVWVKSNFLALRGLNKYHKRFNRGVGVRYSVDDAEQLIKNGLLKAAWVEWQDKGVFVEAVDDRTGKAAGRKRFANINALLLLISADFFA